MQNWTHWLVYASSSLAEQTTPATVEIQAGCTSHCGSFHDADTVFVMGRMLLGDDNATVGTVSFVGTDLNMDVVNGSLVWGPPAEPVIYIAEDNMGLARSQLGEVAAGVDQLQVAPLVVEGDAYGNFTHFVVYTKSSFAEQTTPNSLSFEEAVAKYQVSSPAFTDEDLDQGEVAGTLTWTAPEVTQTVTGYRIYLSEDQGGTSKSLVGQQAEGTDYFAVPVNTPLQSFAFLLIHSLSATTEQRTPVAVAVVDSYSSVTGLSFTDKVIGRDLDEFEAPEDISLCWDRAPLADESTRSIGSVSSDHESKFKGGWFGDLVSAHPRSGMISRSTAMIGRSTAVMSPKLEMRDYQFWKEKLWARLMEQWAKGFTMTGQSCRTEFPRTHVEALADVDAGTVDRTWDVEVMYGAAGDQGESEMSYKRSPRRMSDLREYLKEIGLCTLREYLKEIGLCTLREYLKEIGLCTLREYLKEIGLCTRKEYLMEIGLCTRKEYLKEIGRCTRTEYLKEIGRCTLRMYLMEIGRRTLRMYLMEIGRRTLRMYLMEIGRCTLSTYLKEGSGKNDARSKSPDAETTTQPTPMELLGVIATGMRQLQEVQLRQMDKKDGPELVKPGISSLPHLDPPGKDTSPVDIQDWLEEVGSIMGDLSDTSHEWWTEVRAVADERYKKWVTATPMEKLTLALPRDSKLEQGKYGRVNARAAGMILGALPAEVKSEMVTKKVTGSSLSLVFKLLTTYRPGGEQEKTLLLEQLTTPEGVATPELAVQALRKWGRWFSRAKDLTVAVPDPVLMVKGLALIGAPVLVKNQDVWLRTTMMRNRLQLDSNPTEETTLDFHKHLQAEMELLSTATSTASRSAPRIKSAAATPDATTATTATPGAKAKPDKKERLCKWFAKSDDGCRRGAECQFQHDWGTTAKTGRCLLCSALGHQKKDCPTKKQGEPAQQSPTSGPKGRGKGDKGGGGTTSSSTAAADRWQLEVVKGNRLNLEPSGDLQQILTDAHQMLKTMMATTTPPTTTTSGAPTYESIQRQLDEMKLKALKVSTPQATEDEGRGALLDSGATHVLRPARDEREHLTSKEVPVVLAGDEKRLLRQTPAGSIILDPAQGKEAQTILPLGGLVESLGCTLKWTRGGLMLKHPKYGTIRARIRAGCPEIADPVQAAMLISELESRRMDELRQRTLELQDRLSAIRMMEAKTEDWRQDLAAYASEGCVVDGLQALYKSPIFKGLPDEVLM
ncbi:GIP [Symbiodinium sp. CCMP2592]|nr:GIP [Symbiodinium sp. CCMP2592]